MDEERLKRHDLTDVEWLRPEPLLPVEAVHGARWNDHRVVLNGIFSRTRTACARRELPPCYGRWKTVYNRHRRWSLDGTWERTLDGLRAGCDEAEGEDWTVSVDSTVVRAHQHAAGARHARAKDDSSKHYDQQAIDAEQATDGWYALLTTVPATSPGALDAAGVLTACKGREVSERRYGNLKGPSRSRPCS